jgi:hypothetical protein
LENGVGRLQAGMLEGGKPRGKPVTRWTDKVKGI